VSGSLVTLSGVGVRLGGHTVLRAIDLDVAAGEVIGLFGRNGAGKTTLLRVLASLIRPTTGRAEVLGVDVAGPEAVDVRGRIGYIGHTPGLYPELTLAENLEFAADVGGYDRSAATAALAAVGLAAAGVRRSSASSFGMQRRTEFARELMRAPTLLLLDEPHSSLDRDAVDLVEALVARTVADGGAAVLVSHDRDRVTAAADRTTELEAGTLA